MESSAARNIGNNIMILYFKSFNKCIMKGPMACVYDPYFI